MTTSTAADRALSGFHQTFGGEPAWRAVAPGRVNLIGEHTDYNDGFVLPMAIEAETVCAGRITTDRRVVVHSLDRHDTVVIDLARPVTPSEPRWANYLRGVIAGFQRLDAPLPGLQVAIASDVPIGGGLSSSAALEISMATLLEAACGWTLDPVAKALLCQRAEHEFAGVPSGIMDQFTVTFARPGHAVLLDCRSYAMEHVPMADPRLAVLIVNTNVKHNLASGAYAQRRAECEAAAHVLGVPALRDATRPLLARAEAAMAPILVRRARHVIDENHRTLDAADALRHGDWGRMGDLMYASHASLRDDYAVSCEELDLVVDIARGIGVDGGVWGCRMTGGGFGGCAVALVDLDRVEAIERVIATAYEPAAGRAATLFVTRAGTGTRVLAPVRVS